MPGMEHLGFGLIFTHLQSVTLSVPSKSKSARNCNAVSAHLDAVGVTDGSADGSADDSADGAVVGVSVTKHIPHVALQK